MIVCPACEHVMSGQPVRCEACEEPLKNNLNTASLAPDATLVMAQSMGSLMPKRQKVWRSAEVTAGKAIELIVNGHAVSVAVSPDQEITLGRGGDDVDDDEFYLSLRDHSAFALGVSRHHAALTLSNGMLVIRDLGSTNGTFVNGQRVTGEDWRVVRHQDELRLGSLSLKLHLNGAS